MSKATTTKTTAPKADAKKKEPIVIDNSPEAKRKRFTEIVSKRVKKAMTNISNVGNCSNRSHYEYTPEQVKYTFKKLREAIDKAEERFQPKAEAKVQGFDLQNLS
jgi:hypothetical protein